MTFKELQTRLAGLTPQRMESLCLESIKASEEEIVNRNTDQLWSGQRSDGELLPDYSPASVEIFGKPPGPIRLFDEGGFYRGIFLDTSKFPVKVDSKDYKADKLKLEYGDQILGLNNENLKDVSRFYTLPALAERIRAYLRL